MRIASFEEKEWIDAQTDRVPMTHDEVLVSLKMKSGRREIQKGNWTWSGLGIGEIEAWQPLPEPYGGAE